MSVVLTGEQAAKCLARLAEELADARHAGLWGRRSLADPCEKLLGLDDEIESGVELCERDHVTCQVSADSHGVKTSKRRATRLACHIGGMTVTDLRSGADAADEPREVAARLGKARPAWEALRAFLDAVPGATSAWKFYGAKHSWQLKVTMNRRALVYLIPRAGSFTAALALRRPAVAALRDSKLAAAQIREIEAAKPSPEGQPARIVVTGARQLAWVKQLVMIKLQTS